MADIDADGDLDVIGAGFGDDSLMWWENTAGDGSAWIGGTIAPTFNGARSVLSADLDADGDLDVLGANQHSGGSITWFENTAGDGSAWTEHRIAIFADGLAVEAADLDGDGDLDVLGAGSAANRITWWENTSGDATTWTARDISTTFAGARSVRAADIDQDGDMDVAGAAVTDDQVTWWENTSGDGTTWAEHLVATAFDGAYAVSIADLDGDGDPDLSAAAFDGDTFSWWENTGPCIGPGGACDTWLAHPFAGIFNGAQSVEASDLDQDGDMDLLATVRFADDVLWFENTAGNGSAWATHTVASDFARADSATAADLDGDGDLDIVASGGNANTIAWWPNETIHRSFLAGERGFVGQQYLYITWIDSADVDGDGDQDIIGTSARDRVLYFENTAGDGSIWTQHNLQLNFEQARMIKAGDLDGDGDIDLVAIGEMEDQVAWWENSEGDGSVWIKHIIDSVFDRPFTVEAVDLDQDGDIDVLAAGFRAQEVVWFDNQGGGAAWQKRIVKGNLLRATFGYAGDMDGDGDLDVVISNRTNIDSNGDLAWMENSTGDASVWIDRAFTGTNGTSRGARLTDFDHDGDLDLVGVLFEDNDVLTFGWIENSNSDATSWIERVIHDGPGPQFSLTLGDLDGDGDLDLIEGSLSESARWYENPGDTSSWTNHSIDPSFTETRSVNVADINGDGRLDILAGGRVPVGSMKLFAWWPNLGGHFALPTADAVDSPAVDEGSADLLLLRIEGQHRGREGDGDAELATLELRFEATPGEPLDDAALAALVDRLRLYRDDGDGLFEPGTDDTLFYTLSSPFFLAAGVLTATLLDGDPNVQIPQGQDVTWFLTADLAPEAGSATPNTLMVSHLTESSSTGEMSASDLPLLLEHSPDISSTQIEIRSTLEVIFADGFESGDFAAWEANSP
jgi:hypothetical protein